MTKVPVCNNSTVAGRGVVRTGLAGFRVAVLAPVARFLACAFSAVFLAPSALWGRCAAGGSVLPSMVKPERGVMAWFCRGPLVPSPMLGRGVADGPVLTGKWTQF